MPHRRLYFNEDTKMWTCPDGVQRRIVLRECSSAESTPAPVTPTSPSVPLVASHSAGYYDKVRPTDVCHLAYYNKPRESSLAIFYAVA